MQNGECNNLRWSAFRYVVGEMPDDERPSIRNRGDLLRVLNTYVDDQLRQPLAAQVESELQSQGKELVPREAAKQRYLQQYQEEDYATIYEAKDGKALGMSDIQLEAMKQEMDLGIDRVLEKMRGEAAVAEWYTANGYQVVETNWRCRQGELDLIVRKGRVLVFCEVKTRTSAAFGHPAEAVTPAKARRLRVLASRWLPAGSSLESRFNGDRVAAVAELLRRCVDWSGDVDTVATIALAAASCSKAYARDIPDPHLRAIRVHAQKDVAELLGRRVEDLAAHRPAGVVDQDVEPAEMADGPLEQVVDFPLAGQVGRHADCFVSRAV